MVTKHKPNAGRRKGRKMPFLSLVTLTFDHDIQTRPSDGSNVFRVNLAQICSVVPEIFHTQTNKSSAVAEMGDRSHNRHRPKSGWGLCLFFWAELGPHRTQYRLDWGLPPYQVASWYIQPFCHTRHGPKIGLCSLFGGAGSPSSTMWPGPRPTSMPSAILIHPAIWSQ